MPRQAATNVEETPGGPPSAPRSDLTSLGAEIVSQAEARAPGGALRRARLRAAAGLLFATLAALFAWRAVTSHDGPVLLALHAAVVAGLAICWVVLRGGTPLGVRGVRGLEFAVFALAALYLAGHHYDRMVRAADPEAQEARVVAAVKSTLIATILLTFAYCMLIPNTWRVAATAAAAIVLAPLLGELLLLIRHPSIFEGSWAFATLDKVGEDVVLMLLAVVLSVYGTHVINGLRIEAQVARQLNQYRLGRRIGSGGMGEVYLAEHQLLKRPCALKLIRPARASDPLILSRFEREVRATARLSHPNTVEIYDYGKTGDGTFFYVMEYLRGLGLDELLRRHGPMPPGRVIWLLRQVCGALAEAHAAGLIHRDVKPANILACQVGGHSDVAKLLDFGLVKGTMLDSVPAGSLEVSGDVIVRGTPLFMAPEQVTGHRPLDHRVDIYALGAVAYTMLTGQPPFLGEDSMQVMRAQVRDPVAPPGQVRPGVPEDLERVVLRCLAKWPERRYADATELAAALGRCEAAADWDVGRADRWWREFEPGTLEA